MEVQIPGGVAILREKVTIGGRQALDRTLPAALPGIRKVIARRSEGEHIDENTAASEVGLTEAEFEGLQRFQNAAVVAFLKNWSIDETVPRTVDEVLELDPDIYTPIAKATSPLAMAAIKRPATNPDSGMKDGLPDPDSPTGPSTASDSGERAEQSTPADQSTESLPSDTTPTPIAEPSLA